MALAAGQALPSFFGHRSPNQNVTAEHQSREWLRCLDRRPHTPRLGLSNSRENSSLRPVLRLVGVSPFRRRAQPPPHAVGSELVALVGALKSGTAVLGAYLEHAPVWTYLAYLVGAGVGLPFSEDALVAWIGSRVVAGFYPSWAEVTVVLAVVYAGVVLSDLVTFYIGVLLKLGFFKRLKRWLFRNTESLQRALDIVQKRSGSIGAVQRLSIGFRGPLCLVCGFMGVSQARFLTGVALAAPVTMAAQMLVGYLLRDCGNVYLAALAIVAGPNLIGHAVAPAAAALGLYFAARAPVSQKSGSQGI